MNGGASAQLFWAILLYIETMAYCQDKGMPLKAARGERKLGANGCWERLWSKERLVASLTATPRSGVRSGGERVPVFWAPSSPFFTDYSMVC